MIERCVLHIGSEKTGTTSIQHYFGTNREALLDEGFWYPSSLAPEDSYVHRKLSDVGRGRKNANAGSLAEEFSREYEVAARRGARVAVLSSEFFHSAVRKSDGVESVREFLAPHFGSVRVVYYARRQDHLVASMYSTAVRGGFITDPSALVVYDRKGHHYFDHLAVCGLWSGAFGRENLVCRIYERDKLVNRDIIDDFSSVIGLRIDTERKRVSANTSMPHVAMRALLLLNASRHSANEDLRHGIVSKGRKDKGPKIPMLTKSQARTFMDRFGDSNARFFEQYVDATLAKGFSESFADFPDSIPEVSADQIQDFIFGP